MHLQPLGRNRHIVPVMHVLKTDVPNIVIGQFPDFLGHLALQDAGQPFIDLLPIEWDGLGGDTQELRGIVRLSNSTVSYRHSPTRSSLVWFPEDAVSQRYGHPEALDFGQQDFVPVWIPYLYCFC